MCSIAYIPSFPGMLLLMVTIIGMAIAIKSTAEIAAKFQEVTPGRAPQYAEGVATTTKDWSAATLAAEAIWKAAITAAAAAGRYGSGVKKAGTEKWRTRTLAVGPSRFAEGVSNAGPAYAEGFDPYRNVIAGLSLSPRGPAGDPRNIDRVRQVAEALHKKKLAG